MSGISTAARRELVESVGARYRSAAVDDKRRMLDEFVAITGYHRKHASALLRGRRLRLRRVCYSVFRYSRTASFSSSLN